ncbi:hypothetical protein AGMMS49965_19530 [Bacteroidia bacterium]|nr:hypothetical protein AGMMS49965_19530 [Bacteroidia bacterium]
MTKFKNVFLLAAMAVSAVAFTGCEKDAQNEDLDEVVSAEEALQVKSALTSASDVVVQECNGTDAATATVPEADHPIVDEYMVFAHDDPQYGIAIKWYGGADTEVVIPPAITYDGTEYKVAKIGNYSFYGRADVVSVVLPASITEIQKAAFYGCSSLTTINIPPGVKKIGKQAFTGCTSLDAASKAAIQAKGYTGGF